MKVSFPWPPACLSPNGRAHWGKKAKAAAKTRRDASIACQAAGVRALPWSAMHVQITFHPATKRAFDLDNAVARCKSLLDGVSDAVGIDDSLFTIAPTKGDPVKGGVIIITVSEGKA